MVSLILSALKNITLGLSCGFNFSHIHPFCPTSTYTSGGCLKMFLSKMWNNLLPIHFHSLKLSIAALFHLVT